MSYTNLDARIDFECRVQDVLNNRDVEGAYGLAEALAEKGNEEDGEYFYQLARRWDNEDWAYDRANNN
jgi:hypothetical protein